MVRVPPGVHHGWKCISTEEAIVINAATEPYSYESPDEFRAEWNSPDIPYSWDIVFQ
jgi:dTDP-4-dehydrorhamnose 3,5-epimerase